MGTPWYLNVKSIIYSVAALDAHSDPYVAVSTVAYSRNRIQWESDLQNVNNQ